MNSPLVVPLKLAVCGIFVSDGAIDARERDVVDDAVDGLGDDGCQGDDSEDSELLESLWERDGIGDDDGIEWVVVLEKVVARVAKDWVDSHHADALGAVGPKSPRTGDRASAGIDHVIDHDAVSSFDFADDVHDFWFKFVVSSLIDDGDWGLKHLSEVAGAVDSAVVRRDDGDVLAALRAFDDVVSEKRNGSKVID